MATRIMSAIIQYVLTTSNEHGEPIDEAISQPIRVFRVVHPDVWAHGDRRAFAPTVPEKPVKLINEAHGVLD